MQIFRAGLGFLALLMLLEDKQDEFASFVSRDGTRSEITMAYVQRALVTLIKVVFCLGE